MRGRNLKRISFLCRGVHVLHPLSAHHNDHIDYEEFVSQQRDPLAQVLDFPEDAIKVNLVPRKIRTEEHVVPKRALQPAGPHITELCGLLHQ